MISDSVPLKVSAVIPETSLLSKGVSKAGKTDFFDILQQSLQSDGNKEKISLRQEYEPNFYNKFTFNQNSRLQFETNLIKSRVGDSFSKTPKNLLSPITPKVASRFKENSEIQKNQNNSYEKNDFDNNSKLLEKPISSNEKASQNIPETIRERSFEKIQALDDETRNDPKKLLEALRNDKNVGGFWRSLDDGSAILILSELLSEFAGTSNYDEGFIGDILNEKFLDKPILCNQTADSEKKSLKGEEEKPLKENIKGAANPAVVDKTKLSKEDLFPKIDTEGSKNSLEQNNSKAEFFSNISLESLLNSTDDAKSPIEKELETLLFSQSLETNKNKLEGFDIQNQKKPVIAFSNPGRIELNQNNSLGGQNLEQKVPFGWREIPQTQRGESVKAPSFADLIEKAHLQKNSNQGKVLTLQLKPESLGTIDLKLTSKDGVIIAKVFTDNPLVHDRLEQVIPQIKEHLSAQGVNIQQLTVDISLGQPNDHQRNFSQSQSQKGDVASEDSDDQTIDLEREIDVTSILARRYSDVYPAEIDITA